RARGGAAGLVDVDVVFDAAVAGFVDDLIPGDVDAGEVLDFVELEELDELHAVLGGAFVSLAWGAGVVVKPAAIAVALSAVDVLRFVVDDADALGGRVIAGVAEHVDAGVILEVVVVKVGAVEEFYGEESARRFPGDVGVQAIAARVADGDLGVADAAGDEVSAAADRRVFDDD